MIKVAFFPGVSEAGQVVFPLFVSPKTDREFEKKAESIILPDVAKYIAGLKPLAGSQYVLVNAMGAGEYYSSNINGDFFPEAALIHCPDQWYGVPDIDKLTAKNWPYGFPTFYNAHPFMHHRNKDPSRAYGEVELAAWNPRMKRVELVIRIDKDKCDKFGGTGVWDKIKMGMYVDLSMGCKVPFDTCSICLDWDEYRKAQQTFDPKKHKYVGEAVLAYHKKLIADRGHGIRGLSITRKDYCEHARNNMNKILPDGRKVFVYNDYPRFFDISFVFIGADKTAKVMMKIASDSRIWSLPGAELAEHLGYVEEETTKAASLDTDMILKEAFEMPELPTPATGIRRVWQLLSGSHARDLANFNARAVINELNKQRIAAGEGEGAYHAMMAQAANLGRQSDELLAKEREAVRQARILAGVATGAVGLGGAGLVALNRAAQKEADEANEDILKVAFLGKSAKLKRGEIEKRGPTQFDSKAIPLLTQREPHLTREQIDEMCEHPLGGILSSPTSMGILLRPREFQRIVIIKMGLRPLADELEEDNVIFPRVGRPGLGTPFGPPIARILSLLSSLFSERSALSPALDRRVTLIIRRRPEVGKSKNASSHQTTLLNKIGSAYLAYRNSVMDYWSQDRRSDLEKTASSLSANTFEYLKHAYWNEVGRP